MDFAIFPNCAISWVNTALQRISLLSPGIGGAPLRPLANSSVTSRDYSQYQSMAAITRGVNLLQPRLNSCKAELRWLAPECNRTNYERAFDMIPSWYSRKELSLPGKRMRKLLTGIRHDPVMVFPQGAFSSACPEVLKRNGFLAAVNTEIAPIDAQNVGTRIKDVWDVARNPLRFRTSG